MVVLPRRKGLSADLYLVEQRLAGARHIVQQLVLRGLPQPESIESPPPGIPDLFGRNSPELVQNLLNRNANLLCLEFMKYGDVWKLLQKAGSHPKTWRSQELWNIWHCRKSLSTLIFPVSLCLHI